MKPILLALCLACPAFAAEPAVDDAKVIKFVESFVNIPVDQIPPDRVGDFMKVDLAKLPKKLREKAEGRKLELHALKGLAEGNQRGYLRMPEPKCPINDDAKSDDPKALKMAGFQEIEEAEETHVEKETNCTERDLMCEFSLQIVLKKDKAGKVIGKRYFLHPSDPLMALVAAFRSDTGGNTPTFGQAKANCQH